MVKIDTTATTHRNAQDCTCYDCMREETRQFMITKREKDESIQLQTQNNQRKTGRLS